MNIEEILGEKPVAQPQFQSNIDWTLVNTIKRDPKKIISFMQRVANSRKLALPPEKGGMPSTQQFIRSLFIQTQRNALKGIDNLSVAQKTALDKTITKYATDMVAVLKEEFGPRRNTAQSDEQIERNAIQSENDEPPAEHSSAPIAGE